MKHFDEQRAQRGVNVSKASLRKSTIYDLATLAQTSASTVSAILNGTWQQRRISEETAHRVRALAEAHKYTVNRQARGLRRSRSGLIGMIIPTHEDRFFGTMSQVFDRMARARKLQPIVVSTLRNPALEVSTVKTLISYQIDHLVVTGATDPDSVSRVCRHHNVMHVNVDLPGSAAPSVISDNYWGAAQLTTTLIERSTAQASKARDRLHFLGGVAGDHAIQRRIQGFSDRLMAAFGASDADQIHTCGYEVDAAQAEVAKLYATIGGLPRGLFLASSVSLEGAVRFLKTLPADELQRCAFGSYDWDPFATCLRFPVHMVRQDVDGLLNEAFKVIDRGDSALEHLVEVRPHLVFGD
jgi:LacI family transcriptional regulator, fructose operon transcriptional repressor